MKNLLITGFICFVGMLSLVSCKDNSYSLSDVDTTTELKMKDLVVPLNIEKITLSDIFNIKEGDKIKEVVVNGKRFYAISESGSFSYDPIKIPKFSLKSNNLTSVQLDFNTSGIEISGLMNRFFPFPSKVQRNVVYSSYEIDRSIESLYEIYTDNFFFNINFELQSIPEYAEIKLTELVIRIPKGLSLVNIPSNWKYDYSSGILNVPELVLQNGSGKIDIELSKIDLEANGSQLKNGLLNLSSPLNIESGYLAFSSKDGDIVTLPAKMPMNISFDMKDMNISAISGEIEYRLSGEGLNLLPVELKPLPDFLAQDETNLILSNPQIYLNCNNPLARSRVGYRVGVKVTSRRENQYPKVFTPNNGAINIGFDKGVSGPYNSCLSPEMPTDIPDLYSFPEHVLFSTLGDALSGEGLPDRLEIDLVNPQIYRQVVSEFMLGDNLGTIKGQWQFLAPLSLVNKGNDKSKIVFTKTDNGWSETLIKDMKIEELEMTMSVDNLIPLSAEISGYPIDIEGHRINGVSIEGAKVPGNTKGYVVTLRITGEIKNLDGICFTANLSSASTETLSPSQTLSLNDIRARVTGSYIRNL